MMANKKPYINIQVVLQCEDAYNNTKYNTEQTLKMARIIIVGILYG